MALDIIRSTNMEKGGSNMVEYDWSHPLWKLWTIIVVCIVLGGIYGCVTGQTS